MGYPESTIASMLSSKFGFEVNRLQDASVTVGAIEAAIVAATSDMDPGDAFVLVYAGHGTRQSDQNGDETDGLDEGRYLYDGTWLDDRIRQVIDAIPAGVKVTFVFDSCFSGSGTREMGLVRATVRRRPRMIPEEQMRELLFSGTAEGQLGWMYPGTGGCFSLSFVRALSGSGNNVTAATLFKRVADDFSRSYGFLPQAQNPQLEGPQAAKDARVFV